MCGRFYVASNDEDEDDDIRRIIEEIDKRYKETPELMTMRLGEVFPTMVVPSLAVGKNGAAAAFLMQWGLKSAPNRPPVINARLETAFQKPMFAPSLRERRCALPARCYFEWEKKNKVKNKYAITCENKQTVYLAGIYRYEQDRRMPRFTILTRPAARHILFIHDRMPVIIAKNELDEWLCADVNLDWIERHAQTEMLYERVQ
ncbi:MAG: SOS response-associated peptidase [Clostridia bacterium]|nr:SOS response-associated peptidase [Clostridia bacterium]